MGRQTGPNLEGASAAASAARPVLVDRRPLDFLHSDFVRKVSETFAAKALTFCFGSAISIFIARALGPSGRGTYATALVLTALGVQFGNFGLHAANTFFIAKDRQLLRQLISNALCVSAGIGTLLAVILVIVAKIWPAALPLHGTELSLALAGIPLGIAYLLLQNLLLGCYQIRNYNQIEVVNRSVNLALLLGAGLVVVMSPSVALSINLVAAAGGIVFCLFALSPDFRLLAPSWQLFLKTFSYGCRAYLTALFGFVVLKADLMVVARILGAKEAGFYSVAVNLSDMMYVLPTTIGGILFPKLAQMTDRNEKWKQTMKVCAIVVALMVALCIIAALASTRLIPLLFGASFHPSIPAFNWLLPGMVCMSLISILSAYVASERIPWSLLWIYAVMGTTDIVINFLWLPRMGITGAAQLSSACYLGCLIGVFLVARSIAAKRIDF